MLRNKYVFLTISILVITATLLSACGPAAAPTAAPEATKAPEPVSPAKFECTDEFGCVDIKPGAPVRIAYMFVVSGPDASLGTDTKRGVEIALDDKGKILDHPIELVGEDSLCNAEGGQTAATKLAADTSIVGIVGTNCSSAARAAVPIICKANIPIVSPSNTAPDLTAPDRPGDYHCYLRTAHNDLVQGKAAAEFAWDLGVKTAATVHDGSLYADKLQQVFADEFKKLGGTITSQEAVQPTDTDMKPMLTRIAADKPDFIYYPIFIAAGGHITKQAKEVPGLEDTVLMGADGMFSPDFLEAAGPAAKGIYHSSPDFSAFAAGYQGFLDKHQAKYGEPPLAPFHAHAYDAAMMIFEGVEKVGVQDADGTLHVGRKALRDALLATKNLGGLTGNLTCTATGDCADPKIVVYQTFDPDPASWNPGAGPDNNPRKIWPGELPAPTVELLSVSAPCEANKMKEIAAVDEMTVRFTMCKPDPAFLAKVAFTPFFIQPREWIEETGGTGELLEHPIGTGAYMLDRWDRGDSITFKRFDDYWSEPAKTETLVFRWAVEGTTRLLELQSGTVDHITKLSPDDYETVRNDPSLQFLPVPNPNIMYLAMTNTFEPFGDVKVRQAIAMGIDRQRIVDNFYPAGSEVASHFTPCSIPNGCQGEAWYEFDPEAARALLAEAGYPDGFQTSIFYRDVFRVYLPEPALVAVELQTQLKENLGIEAEVVVMESGEFIDESTGGRLDGLYMLGWGADYLHVTNFLDFHFSRSNPQFGDPHPEIYEVLEEASTIADEKVTAPLYEKANNAIRELVPMVPVAHGAPADAARADVEGAHTAVLGPPTLKNVVPGDRDTLIYMKAAEPISVYCMDETDGESLDACKMVTEGLYVYDEFGVAQPTLATSCEANEDSTVWTCYLRKGVKFHDGSTLDANDVVRSWEAGMDAKSPYHVGNTGAFEYPSYLFDALMNAE